MRKAIVTCAVVPIVLVLLAQPAAAIPPTTWDDHVEYDQVLSIWSCPGFDVLISASAEHRWTEFYDNAGEVTLTSLHFTFTGTMYNETDLTKSIPYRGGGFWTYDAQYVWDLATYRFLAMVDGRPVPLLVGLEKFTYDPFEIVSHINDRFVPVVCDALS